MVMAVLREADAVPGPAWAAEGPFAGVAMRGIAGARCGGRERGTAGGAGAQGDVPAISGSK